MMSKAVEWIVTIAAIAFILLVVIGLTGGHTSCVQEGIAACKP